MFAIARVAVECGENAFDEAEDETIRLLSKGQSTVKVEINDLLLDELFACSALPKETRIKALKGFGRN